MGTTDAREAADLAAADLATLTAEWLGWFDADRDAEPPFFPERRSEIADHLRHVRAVLDDREQLTARIAELEQQRDDDTRAVRRLIEAMPGQEEGRALNGLCGRFAVRVAELAARDEPHSCGNCEGIAVDSCVNFRAEESMRDEQEQNCGDCGCVGCHQCDPRERLGGN